MDSQPAPSASSPRPADKWTLISCLLLAAGTLVVYNRAASCEFINFDDPEYVVKNAHVQAGLTWDTIKWALTSFAEANWHPLTWWSHALDVQLFHMNPAGHHYVNVLFHAASVVILFLALLAATRRIWPSFMVAALWALHPLNVESVAWVAERKNVLSMFFFLLALYAYRWYVASPKARRYTVVASLFALGLMAKPQVITFPMVLLLWDYWPLQRLRSSSASPEYPARSFSWLVREKLPLFLLVAASAVITLQAQRLGHAVRTTAEFSLASRLENALVAYVRYIQFTVWPAGLSPVYPHPENSIASWQAACAAALLALITALALWQKQRRYLLVGWLWFLGTLVPMIGLVQVGQQAMADRYAYLPLLGLLIMVVWGVAELIARWRIPSPYVAVVAVSVLLALAIVTYRQLGYWHTSESLWTRALAVTRNNYTAHGNLADALARQQRSEEAIVHYEAAARLHAYEPAVVLVLGRYELQNGHPQEAIAHFKQVAQSPQPAMKVSALDQLGSAYLHLGKAGLAGDTFNQALQINPDDPVSLVGTGLLAYRRNPGFASRQFAHAVSVEPSDVRLLLLAAALKGSGDPVAAQNAQERARQISPDLPRAEQAAKQLLDGPVSN